MARVKIINGRQSRDLIGANFLNSASQTIFNLGSFEVQSNFTGRRERDYSNQLTSFAVPVTLESLNLEMDDSKRLRDFTNNVKLNLDYSDLKNFARFGSAGELMRVAIRNIVSTYPASLFVNNQTQIGGNVTAIDYSFDVISNTSTFKIPTGFVDNDFDLIFDRGNTATPNDNALRNLNISSSKYVIWRKDRTDDFSHDIIGFTGDSETNPFINVKVVGDPFDDIFSGGTSFAKSFHLRPNIIEYNKYLLTLTDLEKYIINNRNSSNTGFEFILKDPDIDAAGNVVYDDVLFKWATTDGYNIDIASSLFNTLSDGVIAIGEKYDTIKSDLIARMLTPSSIKVYDTTQDGKMTKLLRIYGREFDEIKGFIDSLVTINKTSYDKIDNIPDRLIKNLAETMGWDVFSIVEENELVNAFFSTEIIQNKDNKLPAEIDIELWRRILINTNYYWKSKGTRNAIKSIFRLIGIPEPFVNITEYIYTVEGKIDPNSVELQLEDIPSASFPFNSEGYPVAPVETNDFYFQLSGNTDSGQAYINLYRELGFKVGRVVDNKKSWVSDGRVERVHYSSPNYFQQSNKLIINTKEVDVTLDLARAIEYDVYCYNKEVDDPITSTAVTRPYIYVNVQLSVNDPLTFTLPDTPLSGSNVLMSFNGMTLTPPTGATGGTNYDYTYNYNPSGVSTVSINPDLAVSATTGRDVISVSYISEERRGITGYSEVQYVIEKPINTPDGSELILADVPKGDIQLIVDGKSMTKGSSLFSGDFVLDTSDTGQTRVLINNQSLRNWIASGQGVVRTTYIYDKGESNAFKRSEVHRVDSFNSSKFFFNGGINRNVYVLNYTPFDINSIKLTINGLTLTNGKDFTLNPVNKRQVYLPSSIKINDIIGAYYILDDGSITPPLLPPDDTFPDIQDMSFLEYLELIQRRLIHVPRRKTVTNNKTGYYPTVQSIYDNYIKRSYLDDTDPIKSNGYIVNNLYPFISQYNAFFQRFVDQLLPSTIILNKSGILLRNTSFTRQKFRYPRGVNFDTSLEWIGTDGSEFVRRLPEFTYVWSDDFICEDIIDPCLTFSISNITISEETTTTTTTTTVPPTPFAQMEFSSSTPVDGGSLNLDNSDIFNLTYRIVNSNFNNVPFEIRVRVSNTSDTSLSAINLSGVDSTSAVDNDLDGRYENGDKIAATTYDIGDTSRTINGSIFMNDGASNGQIFFDLYVDQANNGTYVLQDTIAYTISNPLAQVLFNLQVNLTSAVGGNAWESVFNLTDGGTRTVITETLFNGTDNEVRNNLAFLGSILTSPTVTISKISDGSNSTSIAEGFGDIRVRLNGVDVSSSPRPFIIGQNMNNISFNIPSTLAAGDTIIVDINEG